MKGFLLTTLLFLGSVYEISAQVNFGRKPGQQTTSESSGISINYSNPREYEIAEISVSGVQFLDNNALISISGLKVGDKIKIPGDDISTAIKKLWKQGIIGSVNISASKVEGNRIWLKIELSERPRLIDYEFEGINRSQESELKEKVDLSKGRILTDVTIKNTELTVQKYLESKGYLNAQVKVVPKQDTAVNNGAGIRIVVDKGKKVKIKNITFVGDTIFPSSRLKSKLKKTGELPRINLPKDILAKTLTLLNPVNLFHFITHRKKMDENEVREYIANNLNVNVFKSSKYILSEYKEDKKKLLSFYQSKGYRDAEIVSDTVYNINSKYLNIDFVVDPGKKYYFGDITWSGNYVHSDAILDRVLGIDKGDIYDLDLVVKRTQFNPTGADISSLYMDNGYLFFRVDPIEVGFNGDSVNLEMRIFEGAQATIDKVTISGNDKTNDHVVYRELRTMPGQKFNRSELIRTQRELSQLGYFDPEQINPDVKPNPVKETVDIEWQLVERPNDQIELSGGWGGIYGFVGTLGLSFNNFSMRNIPHFDKWRPLPMGDGQKMSVRLQANGRSFQSYSVSFNEPWLGGKKRNNLGISFSHSISRLRQSYFNVSDFIGSLKVSSITVSLGRNVRWPDDWFTVSNYLQYQKYDLYNYGNSLGFSTGVSNSVIFNTTIARNSVDNPMYPRTGSQVSLSASFTPPLSLFNNIDYEKADNETKYKWLEYHKWNFDAKYYLKLLGDLVLAPRAHFGYLAPYSNRVGVGPFERFQLGGSGLTGQNFLLGTDVIGLRGYEDNSITPVDADGIRGGTIFSKYVMELRYPISLNPSATIYVQGFFEAGNNWQNFNEFNAYDLRRSAGLGVRIFMPAFGLLGLDWAYGMDPAPGQLNISGSQFHFSLGQQIR
ncbi:MAG: outer membrane protein assembly factor [Bacteroidota bacterium]